MPSTNNGFGSCGMKPRKRYGRVTIKLYPLGTEDFLRTSINVGMKVDDGDTIASDFSNWNSEV